MTDEDEEGYRPRKIDAWDTPREQPADIAVVVDDNAAVSDVVIPARWQNTVQPQDLGRVLLERANEAIAGRVTEQVERFAVDSPAPVYARREAPSANGDPTSQVAEDLVAEVMQLFARYNGELEAYTARVQQAATATHQAEGGTGRIKVTLAGGQVSAVDVDAAWAAGARHNEIRSEALGAFQAAWRNAELGTTNIPFPPSIARLQELASDPQALSRQLGLSR
jgi:hypothetical protein